MGIAVVMAGGFWLAGCGLGAAVLLGVGVVCMLLGAGGFCFALSLLVIESYCARAAGRAGCGEGTSGVVTSSYFAPGEGLGDCGSAGGGEGAGVLVPGAVTISYYALGEGSGIGRRARFALAVGAVSAESVGGVVEVRGARRNRGPPGVLGGLRP